MLPAGKGIPAAVNADETQPAIIVREAGRTLPLDEIKRWASFKDPHLALRNFNSKLVQYATFHVLETEFVEKRQPDC